MIKAPIIDKNLLSSKAMNEEQKQNGKWRIVTKLLIDQIYIIKQMSSKRNPVKVEQSEHAESKAKKTHQQYKCGDQNCGKFYHSYTAFYNHCKKSHGGQFPKNSLYNDKLFQGPTKNRGRPRIKKTQAKDLIQIESMKKQNQLIEFMGTLKTKKTEQLIVYVENPIERVEAAVVQVKEWLRKSLGPKLIEEDFAYLIFLEQFNKIIDQNDLPEFYDPIETHLYPDNLDSYSFSSVYNFMTRQDMRQKFNIQIYGHQLLFKIYLCWSARMLSQKLFNQVLYIILQIEKDRLDRKDLALFERDTLELLYDKKKPLRDLIFSFFQSFSRQQKNVNQKTDKPSPQKKQKIDPTSAHKDGSKKKNFISERRFASDQGNQDDDEDDLSDDDDAQDDEDNEDDN